MTDLTVPITDRARLALAGRLREVAHALDVTLAPAGDDAAEDAALSLTALLGRLGAAPRADEAWLIAAAISTVLPSEEVVIELLRRAELEPAAAVAEWLLDWALPAGRHGALDATLLIAVDTVVVDVDFSARTEHNTGVQRVVRRVLPHWLPAHDFVPVVGEGGSGIFRSLKPNEIARIERWDSDRSDAATDASTTLVLPWHSILVLMEVPQESRLDGMRALARFSGNRVSAVGYDVIPISSRETVSAGEANKFAKYLGVTKYLASVAGISAAAAEEFAGFASAVAAQGLAGPSVRAVVLPVDAPIERAGAASTVPTRPMILCVGSKEPRKNHVAVLFAAERLWREGLEFDLRFIGSYGWNTTLFRRWAKRLRKAGRALHAPPTSGDSDLWSAYASARFTVFPSLHEGYGLPVAESLAFGVPVITTNYGSTAEIAEGGGCLVVDPRDDEQLVTAMRTLLVDDATLERLRGEAGSRAARGWKEYADEAWTQLVEIV